VKKYRKRSDLSLRDNLKYKTILVTGGAGFLGSHLVDALILKKVKKIIIIDNLFNGNLENLAHDKNSKKLKIFIEDAAKYSVLEKIFFKYKIDIVFNCATKALNYSFINPKDAFLVNTNITINLLEIQRKKLFKTLCHFSTSEVYGSAKYKPMDELHPTNPSTTYAAGKLSADKAIQSYVAMFDLDAFIVRPFNNYGPRQNIKNYLSGVIPSTVKKILSNSKPEIHGSGKQSRDFIYVEDTISAVLKLYDVLKRGEDVNISATNEITIKNLVIKICKLMNYKGKVIKKPNRVADVKSHNSTNKKMKKLINFKITPFDIALKKTLDWYKFSFNKIK
jgi:UDP-glucose 4-epimerase